jgi:hypothetical protein
VLKQVERHEAVLASIQARWIVGAGPNHAATGQVERLGVATCRQQGRVGIKQPPGRQDAGAGFAAARNCAGELHHAAQHVDEMAGNRQVGPAGLGGDMEQHDPAGAALAGCHQRSAVSKAGPGARGKIRRWLGQNLAANGNVAGRRQSGKGSGRRIGGQRLRLDPGERATKLAFALAEQDRQQLAVGRRRSQPWSGKADQCAAALDPFVKRCADILGQGADIRHDDHRRRLGQQFRNGCGHLLVAGFDQVGIGGECAVDIVERREQGLGDVSGLSRYQRHPAAPETVIKQAGRCRGVDAGDIEAGNVVADFEGGRDGPGGLGVPDGKTDFAGCDLAALAVACSQCEVFRLSAVEAACRNAQPVGAVVGTGERQGPGFRSADDADCGGFQPGEAVQRIGGIRVSTPSLT